MTVSLPERSRAVPGIAGVMTIGLLALAGRYGPHRDELYFVAAGHHPQWGYPDQPPITPLVAGLADRIAPGSLFALRLVPALLIGAVVVLAADLARELGGERRAQVLTAITVATGAAPLIAGHLLSTSTLDVFAAAVVVRLMVGVLNRDAPRGWLWVGLAAGLGLENKTLVAPLLAGLALGLLLTPALRKHLRSPWLWAGAAIALLLWAPNLWWQAENGWPQITLAGSVRDEYGTLGGLVELILSQVFLLSPLAAVLAGKGLRGSPEPARPVVIAYLGLLVFYAVTGGKGYYLVGLLVPLVAIGAVIVARRWSPRRTAWFAGATVAVALFPVPAVLPVLPAQTYAQSFYPDLGEDGLETIGWPRFVDQVRAVAEAVPPDQRGREVVVTENYGEAGALLWYGGAPPVYSGHNGFGDWGPPPAGSGPVLYVGGEAPRADVLPGCRRMATLDTGVDNEENGKGVWLCQAPPSWPRAWESLRRLVA